MTTALLANSWSPVASDNGAQPQLIVSGCTAVVASSTAHWPANIREGPPAIVSLGKDAEAHSSLTVQQWLRRLIEFDWRDASLARDTAALGDVCVSFYVDVTIGARTASTLYALVTPQAAEVRTIHDVLLEAVLPRLESLASLQGEAIINIAVPTVVVSTWGDVRRTEEHLLPRTASGTDHLHASMVKHGRSTATKRQRSPTAVSERRGGAVDAASPQSTAATPKLLEFATAASPMSRGMIDPSPPLQHQALYASPVSHSALLSSSPHLLSLAAVTLPATDLKVLNNWIHNRRLPKVHIASSLLCLVCGLMPTLPVIATCCGSTQCRSCSNPTLGTSGAILPSSSAKITCAICGEERMACEVLPPNLERAAAVVRWAKDIAVLYREELMEMERGILPLTLASPHQQSVLESPDARWNVASPGAPLTPLGAGGPPGSRHILYAPPPPPSHHRQPHSVAMEGAPPPPGAHLYAPPPPPPSSILPLSPHSPHTHKQW